MLRTMLARYTQAAPNTMTRPEAPRSKPWFDLLPAEVCERIAAHASGGRQTESALQLAGASAKLRYAVLSALSRKLQVLEFPRTRSGSPACWTELALPDVTDLELRIRDSHQRKYVHDLLKAPKLRCAFIADDPGVLRAVAQSRSIRELKVRIRNYIRDRDATHELLFQALSALRLDRLTLVCCVDFESSQCPFKSETYLNPAFNALPSCFSHLKSLEIQCARVRDGARDPVWRMFPVLHALQELSFSGDPPHDALPKLRDLDSVRIKSGPNAHRLAMQIGTAVTELKTKVSLDEEKVASLSHCPRLTSLAVTVAEGAERALPDVIRALPLLDTLHINWGRPTMCLHGHDGVHSPCYAMALTGVTLGAVEAAPKLADLRLTKVRLSLSELTAVLRAAGSELRTFWTSISDQDESQLDRLEALLCTATQHNPELREFKVPDVGRRDGHSSAVEAKEHGRRLFVALRLLQQHAPYLDTQHVDRTIMQGMRY